MVKRKESFSFERPFFSVLLPFYNAEKFIERPIESLAKQTFSNFELLAYNDASTDNSLGKVEKEIDKIERFSLFSGEKNIGVGKSLSFLSTMARGLWIARIDADDAYAIDYLESRKNEIIENPMVEFFYGGMKVIGGSQFVPDAENPKNMIKVSDTSQGPTAIIKKSCLTNIGGFQDLRYGEDYQLFMEISKKNIQMKKINDERYHYYKDNENSLTRLEELKNQK